MSHSLWTLAAVASAMNLTVAGSLSAGQIEFFERVDWEDAVDSFTTIDFTGFPGGTFITDQYSDLGIEFTDGNDSIFPNEGSFVNDGVGLDGNGDIAVAFDEPQAWIAAEFPGMLQFELYRAGELVYESSIFSRDPIDNFFGLVFADRFDMAILVDPGDDAEIDDLLFGAPVPGSPAFGLLGLIATIRGRRRRSSRIQQDPTG